MLSVWMAQELLRKVEKECAKVQLRLNPKKTKTLTFNISVDEPLKTFSHVALKKVEEFRNCWYIMHVSRCVMGWCVVCDCDISWSYSLTFSSNWDPG